ncbi:hypothetical protein [Thiolapillus sp.]
MRAPALMLLCLWVTGSAQAVVLNNTHPPHPQADSGAGCNPAVIERVENSFNYNNARAETIYEEIVSKGVKLPSDLAGGSACIDALGNLPDFTAGFSLPGLDDIIEELIAAACAVINDTIAGAIDRFTGSLEKFVDLPFIPGYSVNGFNVNVDGDVTLSTALNRWQTEIQANDLMRIF